MGRERVVILGAGIGGLAAGLDLAARGADVTLIEADDAVGGKVRAVDVGGVAVDGGPTVLTMRWVFDELFEATGSETKDYLDLIPLDVLARHAWPDGAELDLFADADRSEASIRAAFGEREARGFVRFRRAARDIYARVEAPFLRAQRPTWRSVLAHGGLAGMTSLARIDAFRTMAAALEAFFVDPRLRQLFGRYATYCGGSPFEAPATLNLIAHVESEGVHRIRGGMHALATALARRFVHLGGQVRVGVRAERIVVAGGRARGVVLAGGERVDADAMIFNGDVSALGAGLLGDAATGASAETPRKARSLSAVTWALVGHASGFPLHHHNVFFSREHPREFDELVRARRCPAEPTVYVCAQDRDGPSEPPGGERFLVIVNAPPTGDEPTLWSAGERERCEVAMMSALAQCGLNLAPRASICTTPVEWAQRFPGSGGALYGPRPAGALSAFARGGAKTKVPGLYLAGGSVHPGPGVPMAALSGRLAAARVWSDLASTVRSRTAGTSGTTSTA